MDGNDGCTQRMSELFSGDFFGLANSRPDRFTRDRHTSGPYQFLDTKWLQQIDDGLDLLRITRHFDGVRRRGRVDDIRPENIRVLDRDLQLRRGFLHIVSRWRHLRVASRDVEVTVVAVRRRVMEEPAAQHAADAAGSQDDDPHGQAVGAMDSPNAASNRR